MGSKGRRGQQETHREREPERAAGGETREPGFGGRPCAVAHAAAFTGVVLSPALRRRPCLPQSPDWAQPSRAERLPSLKCFISLLYYGPNAVSPASCLCWASRCDSRGHFGLGSFTASQAAWPREGSMRGHPSFCLWLSLVRVLTPLGLCL